MLRGRREGAVNRRGQSAAAQLSIRVTNDIMVYAMTEKIDRYCISERIRQHGQLCRGVTLLIGARVNLWAQGRRAEL